MTKFLYLFISRQASKQIAYLGYWELCLIGYASIPNYADFNCFGYVPGHVIAGSNDTSIFCFGGNQTFPDEFVNLHFHHQCRQVSFLHTLTRIHCFCILDDSHWDWHEIEFQRSFDFYFSNSEKLNVLYMFSSIFTSSFERCLFNSFYNLLPELFGFLMLTFLKLFLCSRC